MSGNFRRVDAVGRLRGSEKAIPTDAVSRHGTAVRHTFDICPAIRGVRRIAADPPRFTAAAGVDRRLYDRVHSQRVAGAMQRRGFRAGREFSVVPLPRGAISSAEAWAGTSRVQATGPFTPAVRLLWWNQQDFDIFHVAAFVLGLT